MNRDNLEEIGRIADSIDNIVAGLDLPLPADFHLQQIKPLLVLWSQNIKLVYESESGENPWG